MWFTVNGVRQLQSSHRISFFLTNGRFDNDFLVCHRCDNPPCVNPTHLFLGTHGENSQDMARKRRSALGDRNGARIHPEAVPRGSSRGHAKLKEEQIPEIRSLYDSGAYSQMQLARRYGVGRCAIERVVNRIGWKHVAEEACQV